MYMEPASLNTPANGATSLPDYGERSGEFYSDRYTENASRTTLNSYATLIGAFGTLFFGLYRISKSRGVDKNVLVSGWDLALLAVATHKITRTLAKDRIMKPIREPFTKEDKIEHKEVPKGTGLQKAVGNLLTCQFCLGPWVATSLLFGFKVAPSFTRHVGLVFATVTGSDFLHLAYQAAKNRTEPK